MSNPSQVEIVTAEEVTQADLRAAAQRINQTIDLLKGHESAFEDATLEHRLCIGLEIAKAQAAFGLTVQEGGKLGGRPSSETLSTVDKVSEAMSTVDKANPNPLGFSAWIAKEIPDLKRPTAIRYATAFAALEITTADATPKLITERLKKIRHDAGKASQPMPTLAALYKLGKPAPDRGPITIEHKGDPKKLRLEDAREFWFLWREQAEKAISHGSLDDLDKKGLEEMKEFQLWLRDRISARLKTA